MSVEDYRRAVELVWIEGHLTLEDFDHLDQLQLEYGISDKKARRAERKVMGMTKDEAVNAMPEKAQTNREDGPDPEPEHEGEAMHKDGEPEDEGEGSPHEEAAPPDLAGGIVGGDSLSVGGTGPRSGKSNSSSPEGDREDRSANEDRVADLKPGDMLKGRWKVLKELGSGGWGQVYQVFDTQTEETQAVKILQSELLANPKFKKRLAGELRRVRQLTHEGIINVYEYHEDETRGLPFFNMEFVEGTTLHSWLKDKDGMPALLDDAKSFSEGIIEAIEYAHSKGVIHSDIKPDNVMINRDNRVVVLDWGISRKVEASSRPILMSDISQAGTPFWMPPELENGGKSDKRSDVSQVAAIIYYLLVGRPPRGYFDPPSKERRKRLKGGEGAELPEPWSTAVVDGLLPDPEDRPALTQLLPGTKYRLQEKAEARRKADVERKKAEEQAKEEAEHGAKPPSSQPAPVHAAYERRSKMKSGGTLMTSLIAAFAVFNCWDWIIGLIATSWYWFLGALSALWEFLTG